MSRSPTILYLADGTELCGLWNGSVDEMWPGVYPSTALRDDAWSHFYDLKYPDPCSCIPEDCVVVSEQYEVRRARVYAGRVCRHHSFLHGPYVYALAADDGFDDFALTVAWWNDQSASVRQYAREHRMTLSRAFEPLLRRLLSEILQGKQSPAPLEDLVIWKA